jgi:hypothetical protein|tara:strand:+ start:435 stop:776 length:342 start_codon:yes stop_codon:yes gene_type:complete
MTIQYKNQGFSLTTTGTTSVLTAPANGRCLVKQIQAHNGSTGTVSLVTQVTDTSASATFRIDNASIAANTTRQIISQTLVLEEGDILKMTAGTADEIQGIVSYALLDRSQENG